VDAPLAPFFKLEMLHRVCDVNLMTIYPSILKRAIEQATRGSYEWPSGEILAVARLLSDQHDPRRRAAFA
jgi:hypothetical protein